MSDLTFGPSFKVKQWFTGFGELSFRWIQIYICSPMRRSSLTMRGSLGHMVSMVQLLLSTGLVSLVGSD